MNADMNAIAIGSIAVAASLGAYFVFKKDVESDLKEDEENVFAIPYLCNGIKEKLNEIVNQNLIALYLSKKGTESRKEQKKRLMTAIRSCAQGNKGEKDYMVDYIRDLLQSKFNINEETIDCVIPFNNPQLLSEQDKFEILLQMLKREHRQHAFGKLNELCKFDSEKQNEYGVHYEVDKQDINNYFNRFSKPLNYVLKLQVVAQRIFQETYGFGCVDEIVYQKDIDGISGGNSGLTGETYDFMEEILQTVDMTSPRSFESVWIILGGKPINFSFLSFGSRAELIRVCKNMYLYDNVGHLTASNGYKLSYLQNGCRVVVTRPQLTMDWAFFLRSFSSVQAQNIDKLVKGENCEIVKEMVRWMVKGLLNIIISGDQNSGKTTFLKCIFQFMDQRYEVRTTEAEFELWLNKLYPRLSIMAFRGTEEVSIIDAINIQKKTNGTILVLGEIADFAQAVAYITLTQSGTKCTYGTAHTVSSEAMVDYFRNAGLSKDGNFSNEMAAEEQVADSINIDIHWEKTGDGRRYISYINEIVPMSRKNIDTGSKIGDAVEALKMMARKRAFEVREIIALEDGKYVFKNPLSERCVKKILKNLSKEEGEKFLAFNSKNEEE